MPKKPKKQKPVCAHDVLAHGPPLPKLSLATRREERTGRFILEGDSNIPGVLVPFAFVPYKPHAEQFIRAINAERTCVHCGCTDSHACPGGCAWAIKHKATHTGVCTACVRKGLASEP
jgi:hypothetical protein